MVKLIHIYILLIFFPLGIRGQLNPQMKGLLPHEKLIREAKIALSSKNYTNTISLLDKSIDIEPNKAEPYLYRGMAEFHMGNYSVAEQNFTECLDKNPFMTNAYRYRGMTRFNLTNYSGAITDYTKCLELSDPNDQELLINRAISYIKLRKYDIAENELDSLAKRLIQPAPVYFAKGMMYLEKGDTIQALPNFNSSISSDTCFAEGYAQRGLIRYSQNLLDTALQDLSKAI